jgi:hypothetical protein
MEISEKGQSLRGTSEGVSVRAFQYDTIVFN